MPIVNVSSKGWVVIPAHLRKKYGIKSGSSVEIEDQGSFLLIKANSKSRVESLFGILNQPGFKK